MTNSATKTYFIILEKNSLLKSIEVNGVSSRKEAEISYKGNLEIVAVVSEKQFFECFYKAIKDENKSRTAI